MQVTNKFIIMKVLENVNNVEFLTDDLLIEIDGGSELTDSIWYGIGYVAGSLYHAAQNIQPQVYQRW